MKNLINIRNLYSDRNKISFSISPNININKADLYLYNKSYKFSNDDFELEIENNIYTITLISEIEDFSVISFFIKNECIFSNIIYIYYSLFAVNDKSICINPFTILNAYIPKEITSSSYNLSSLNFNNINIYSNFENLNICNEIDSYASFIELISSNCSEDIYKLNLYDKFLDEVPDGKYTVKLYLE